MFPKYKARDDSHALFKLATQFTQNAVHALHETILARFLGELARFRVCIFHIAFMQSSYNFTDYNIIL